MTTPTETFWKARDLLLAHRSDHAAASRAFAWPALGRFNWALDHFDELARKTDRTALWLLDEAGNEEKVSYAELAERSRRVAHFLHDRGVRRGDRVLLMLPNVAALWEAMLACIKLGAVIIPATTQLTPVDLSDRLTRGEVKHVIADAQGAPRFDGLGGALTRFIVGGAHPGWTPWSEALAASADFTPPGETHATDPMLLYFTSGTTAAPKLVLHTHQSYPVGHLSTMYWIGLQPGDVHWNISSPGWAKHAWSNVFAPWNAGATVFVFNQARFHAAAALKVLEEKRITTLCAPPTVWRMLILEDLARTKPHLREAVSAGEPLNPEVIERVRQAWGLTVRDGYGQTETTCQVGNTPGSVLKPGSMGRPLPGYTVALLDAEGQASDEGEISLPLDPAPLALMAGYHGDAGLTAKALRGGHYRTGDVATRDAEGYLFYVGRADDVFKASDYRISPFELESALLEHPSVAEAAVVPSPDPVRTSVPKAFIVLAPGVAPSAETARAIFAFVKERLASFRRIRKLEFSDLPKTISGKIRRVELRRLEAERVKQGERGAQEHWASDFAE
jgi:acetyl-CoA synthetase